eukprot:m.138617 g.138617  ORF g.138617 m.138617 type:complete len:380 (-) comp15710_c0_seq1:54-1193(-)
MVMLPGKKNTIILAVVCLFCLGLYLNCHLHQTYVKNEAFVDLMKVQRELEVLKEAKVGDIMKEMEIQNDKLKQLEKTIEHDKNYHNENSNSIENNKIINNEHNKMINNNNANNNDKVELDTYSNVKLESYYDTLKWKEEHFSPIVDEKHKVVVCTIAKSACTVWRKFMRRLYGYKDWNTKDERITHGYGGKSTGLKYLSSYSPQEAAKIMNDPTYFKAAIVRNPLTRILSAWKDKYAPGSVHNWGNIKWDSFANSIHPDCRGDEHWMAQSCFCGLRKWEYDMIARMEDGMPALAEEMVKTGHLSKDFIATGWGDNGNEAFLQTNSVFHKTDASAKAAEYYGFSGYPGIFKHMQNAMQEDIVRFGYEESVQEIKVAAAGK